MSQRIFSVFLSLFYAYSPTEIISEFIFRNVQHIIFKSLILLTTVIETTMFPKEY